MQSHLCLGRVLQSGTDVSRNRRSGRSATYKRNGPARFLEQARVNVGRDDWIRISDPLTPSQLITLITAHRIGQSPAHAAHLLALHRLTYLVFWRWIEGAVSYALVMNRIHSVFGWTLAVGSQVNPRSLQNYPMQSNGAEMLRLACSTATEQGVRVCIPVHDALLIEAPVDTLDTAIAQTQAAMADASRRVLAGFTLRSSVTQDSCRRIATPSRAGSEMGEPSSRCCTSKRPRMSPRHEVGSVSEGADPVGVACARQSAPESRSRRGVGAVVVCRDAADVYRSPWPRRTSSRLRDLASRAPARARGPRRRRAHHRRAATWPPADCDGPEMKRAIR